jgi:KaiC/GvpD/RAD55 family RecA-like ATPase
MHPTGCNIDCWIHAAVTLSSLITILRPDLPRLSSGTVGLDIILGGRRVERASYIVHEQAGAGKTIFSNQLAFADLSRSIELSTTSKCVTHRERKPYGFKQCKCEMGPSKAINRAIIIDPSTCFHYAI